MLTSFVDTDVINKFGDQLVYTYFGVTSVVSREGLENNKDKAAITVMSALNIKLQRIHNHNERWPFQDSCLLLKASSHPRLRHVLSDATPRWIGDHLSRISPTNHSGPCTQGPAKSSAQNEFSKFIHIEIVNPCLWQVSVQPTHLELPPRCLKRSPISRRYGMRISAEGLKYWLNY